MPLRGSLCPAAVPRGRDARRLDIRCTDRDPETTRRPLDLEQKQQQDLDHEEKTAEQVRGGLEGKEQAEKTMEEKLHLI